MVIEKENSLITELALNQNVMYATGQLLRDFKERKKSHLLYKKAHAIHYIFVLEGVQKELPKVWHLDMWIMLSQRQ